MRTLRELLADDVARRALRGNTPDTIAKARREVTCFLRWLEQEVDSEPITYPSQLQPAHIEKWLMGLRVKRLSNGLPLRPFSIRSRIDLVRTFMLRLAERHLVSSNVANAFGSNPKPKLLPRPTPAHRHIRQLFDRFMPTSSRDHTIRAAVEVLYSTGMRPCELLAMDIEHIDREAGFARVMGKGKRERLVPLGRRALRELDSYVQGVRPMLLREPTERALWLNALGRRMGYCTLRESLNERFPSCGQIRFTAYSLRRACATELIRANASIWAVKELLGHQSLDEIEHYVQLTVTDLQNVHARCHPRDRMPDAKTPS